MPEVLLLLYVLEYWTLSKNVLRHTKVEEMRFLWFVIGYNLLGEKRNQDIPGAAETVTRFEIGSIRLFHEIVLRYAQCFGEQFIAFSCHGALVECASCVCN